MLSESPIDLPYLRIYMLVNRRSCWRRSFINWLLRLGRESARGVPQIQHSHSQESTLHTPQSHSHATHSFFSVHTHFFWHTVIFFCPHSCYPFTLSASLSSGLTKVRLFLFIMWHCQQTTNDIIIIMKSASSLSSWSSLSRRQVYLQFCYLLFFLCWFLLL